MPVAILVVIFPMLTPVVIVMVPSPNNCRRQEQGSGNREKYQ
jgi:hypothetical protein